jgi:hypothetical protein
MTTKPIFTLTLIAAALSQMGSTGGCDHQVLRDPSFDLWCGDQMCAWTVERGEVKRVPTWHEGDSGVELVGADTAIEQVSPVDSSDGTCIQFDLVANVDENTEVRLNIDVFDDGTIDYSERLPTSHWQPLTYNLRFKGPYAGVRFELATLGGGKPVLANIGAKTVTGCQGLPEISGEPAPNGAPCVDNAACASGMCRAHPVTLELPFGGTISVGQVCVGCDPAAPACGPGETCGLGEPTTPVAAVPEQCVAQAARELGEACIDGSECASGLCAFGVCSACNPLNSACPAPIACAQAWTRTLDLGLGPQSFPFGPYLCAPNQHQGATGAPCASDDDCASSACAGAIRKQCDDGRACTDAADCPFAGGLQNGECTTVGIQGGSCQ